MLDAGSIHDRLYTNASKKLLDQIEGALTVIHLSINGLVLKGNAQKQKGSKKLPHDLRMDEHDPTDLHNGPFRESESCKQRKGTHKKPDLEYRIEERDILLTKPTDNETPPPEYCNPQEIIMQHVYRSEKL